MCARVKNYAAQLVTFADTAALAACLDVIITVDTAVAHLTAAMNIPTWVLTPFAPDFRWLLEREDTPWYPSMRLFRQERPEDWSQVIHRIGYDLARMSEGARASSARDEGER